MSADNLTLAAVIIVVIMIMVIIMLAKNRSDTDRKLRKMAAQMALIQHNEKARELCQRVQKINPQLCAGIDFTIRENGSEVEIDEWNCKHPKPDL